MLGKKEIIVTLTVLDSLNNINGSNIRDIIDAFARDYELDKTSASTAVRLGIARGKSIGYVVERPRGKYSLKGFGNECGDCRSKMMAVKLKPKEKEGTNKPVKGKGKGRGIAKKKGSGIVKKAKGSVKRAANK